MDSKSPDDVCIEYADRGVKLRCRMLEDKLVLLEGSPEALEFLGHLLLAQAAYQADCGFQLGPHLAGSALFAETSDIDLYIHRLPCEHANHR